MALPAVPAYQQLVGSIIDQAGSLKAQAPQLFFQNLVTWMQAVSNTLSTNPGVNYLTFAQINALSLGPSNVGYVAFVTDYAHFVYWDGAAWQWLDGDRPGKFDGFQAAPGTGWALCDGSATTLLTVGGGLLVATSFTTPNLAGTPAFFRSGGVYSGSINSAVAPGATMSGSTGTGTTGTGTTGTGTTGTGTTGTGNTGTGTSGAGSAHHHSISPSSTSVASPGSVVLPLPVTDDESAHTHAIPALSIPGLSVPGLSVPGLSVPGLSIPALGAGTLAATVDATGLPASLTTLPYVRR